MKLLRPDIRRILAVALHRRIERIAGVEGRGYVAVRRSLTVEGCFHDPKTGIYVGMRIAGDIIVALRR